MPESNLIDSEEEGRGPSKEDRLIASICYAPFGFVFPTLMQKQSDFLSLHTKQGAIIFLTWFILNLIPLPGVFGILTLAYVALASYAGWRAYNGEEYVYSFIQTILDKFKK